MNRLSGPDRLARKSKSSSVFAREVEVMPVSFEFNEASGVIRIRCYGECSVVDVVPQSKSFLDGRTLPNPINVFVDVRELTSLPTTEEVRRLKDSLFSARERVTFGCCAVLADRDAIYGMARMWGVFVEEIFAAVDVFRLAPEAIKWFDAQCVRDGGSILGTAQSAGSPG